MNLIHCIVNVDGPNKMMIVPFKDSAKAFSRPPTSVFLPVFYKPQCCVVCYKLQNLQSVLQNAGMPAISANILHCTER